MSNKHEPDNSNQEVLEQYEAIMESGCPEEAYTKTLTRLLQDFTLLIMLGAHIRANEPPCNRCLKDYDADEVTSCVASQATVLGVLQACKGMAMYLKGLDHLVYPTVIDRMERIAEECKKVLAKCNKEF